jgi:phospholipid-binding lipoprotein MlaA
MKRNTQLLTGLLVFLFLFTAALQPSAVLAEPATDFEVDDSLEGFNRGIFWFNDKLDVNVLEPVARGYNSITPEPIQTGVGNFFENLNYPKYLVSDIVQLKFGQALEHTGRFLLNTTVGVAGFIDVAADFGLPKHKEDFGTALAYHGVPAGPYLVLPLLGPSNIRDGLGRAVDFFLDPFYWFDQTSEASYATRDSIIFGSKALDTVDTRAGMLEAIESAKDGAVDYYLFVQSAYYQHRRGVVYDGNPPEQEQEEYAEDDAIFED